MAHHGEGPPSTTRTPDSQVPEESDPRVARGREIMARSGYVDIKPRKIHSDNAIEFEATRFGTKEIITYEPAESQDGLGTFTIGERVADGNREVAQPDSDEEDEVSPTETEEEAAAGFREVRMAGRKVRIYPDRAELEEFVRVQDGNPVFKYTPLLPGRSIHNDPKKKFYSDKPNLQGWWHWDDTSKRFLKGRTPTAQPIVEPGDPDAIAQQPQSHHPDRGVAPAVAGQLPIDSRAVPAETPEAARDRIDREIAAREEELRRVRAGETVPDATQSRVPAGRSDDIRDLTEDELMPPAPRPAHAQSTRATQDSLRLPSERAIQPQTAPGAPPARPPTPWQDPSMPRPGAPRSPWRTTSLPSADDILPTPRNRQPRNTPGVIPPSRRPQQTPEVPRRTGFIGWLRDKIFGPRVDRPATPLQSDQIPPAVRAWMNEATTIKGLTRQGEAAEHAIRKMRKIGVTEGAQIRTYLDIQNKLQERNARLKRIGKHALLGASMSALSGVALSLVVVGGIPTTAALVLMAASGTAGSIVSATVGDVAARRGWKRPWAYAMASGIATGLATGSLYSLFDTTFTGTTTVEGGPPDKLKPTPGLAAIPSGAPVPDALPSSAPAGTIEAAVRPVPDIGPKMPELATSVPGSVIDPSGIPREEIFPPGRLYDVTSASGASMPFTPENLTSQFIEGVPSEYTVAAGDAVARQGIDGFVKSQMFSVPPLSELNLTRVGKEQFIDAVRRVFVENPALTDQFIGASNRIVDGADGLDLMFKAGDTLNQKIFADGEFLEKLKDTIMSKESVLTRQMGGSGGVESVVYDLSRTFSR